MGGAEVKRVVVGIVAAFVLAAVVGVPAASAEALSPWWAVSSGSQPTNLLSGQPGRIVVTAENRGDANTSGTVTISDDLPAGLEATGIEAAAGEGPSHSGRGPVSCTLNTLTCTFGTVETTNAKGEAVPETLQPYEEIEVDISVTVQAGAFTGEQNTATVSGGGAAGGGGSVSASHTIEVNGSEKFGVEDFQLIAENAGGSVDTRAGSHPFQLTSVITLNTQTPQPSGGPRTVALARDIVSELPAGLIANPTGLAQCSEAQFDRKLEAKGHTINECPAQSAVGVATVTFNLSDTTNSLRTVTAPIFNLTPLPGEPARFGAKALGLTSAFLETSIRSGGDYGVRLAANNISELAWLLSLKLTFWGVPGDARHNSQRGWECLEGFGTCTPSAEANSPPFLSLPSTCGEPLTSAVVGASWAQSLPVELEPLASYQMPALDGCNRLSFEPEIEVSSEGQRASTPNGLAVDVHVPQENAPNPVGLAGSIIRDITIALPAGVAIDPAGANGLEACSEPDIGYLPNDSEPPDDLRFTAALAEPFCPNAAKIGTVKLKTPLLANALEGAVYLADQNANPFGSLIAVYIVANDPKSGVLVKLSGDVSLSPQTGQITVTLLNDPQLPFEDIELSFFGGELGLLATPAHCGTYATTASFEPWSGGAPVQSQSSFQITSGPNGGGGISGCPSSPLPFAPSLTAGTTQIDAGSFTSLTATVSREDGQQPLQGLQLRLPPGLSAMLASVKLCPEAQANAGTCGPESQIGETTVLAGLGGEPYTLTGGRVYLTEGYDGAPFGLAIVTPVKAGPLDLEDAPENHPPCDCLVIRARVEVDPQTAQLTIATGAGTAAIGAGGIPNIIDGIPLQIKDLNLTIDRPGFIFNPTSCNRMTIAGTIGGGEGSSASVSTPFRVANCAVLKFAPKVMALTRANGEAAGHGASLHLAIAAGASSATANIANLKVDLPKQLPTRLTTLQASCRKVVFTANPANCPASSVVGTAKAVTPVLSATMVGPAYFVSNGRESLPDLDIVLQGDGVRLNLRGSTFVSGKDVTSVTFASVPDIPLRSFELSIPEGKYSALGTDKDLCKQKLAMPTAVTGQNGAVVHTSVKVGVTGCPKPLKTASRKKRKGR
jgi:hypothetical protein